MDEKKPRLAITLGDPAGIGTEVILKALVNEDFSNYDLTLFGNYQLTIDYYQQLPENKRHSYANPSEFNWCDIPLEKSIISDIKLGVGNQASGTASFRYLDAAIDRTLAGEFDGIVTAPIAKSAWLSAGFNYPGQTELLAIKSGVDQFGMLFVGRSPHTGWTLRTLLATTHIPLMSVAEKLSPELMNQKLELLINCLKQDFGIFHGRIAIAGLNPHSGENGQLGNEEIDWLIPWIEEAQKKHIDYQLIGPIPPDTMWVKPGQAWFNPHYNSSDIADGFLALYHDQGLIPVKLMAFDQAINTTIGLPFVRTSPDHGTAFDIAGLGIAKCDSAIAAIHLAAELVKQRQQSDID